MGIHTKIGQRNHACVPLRRILHVWGIKDDYYRLHLNIVMVGFLKTFCTLKVIMVAAVQGQSCKIGNAPNSGAKKSKFMFCPF